MLQRAEIGFALRNVCTKPPCSSILCFVQREIVEIEQELLYIFGLPIGNIKKREIDDISFAETLVLGMIEYSLFYAAFSYIEPLCMKMFMLWTIIVFLPEQIDAIVLRNWSSPIFQIIEPTEPP